MKIQEDLVWDKHSGELIGFVDLGDSNVNMATVDNLSSLATHVLVFLFSYICNNWNYSYSINVNILVCCFFILKILI